MKNLLINTASSTIFIFSFADAYVIRPEKTFTNLAFNFYDGYHAAHHSTSFYAHKLSCRLDTYRQILRLHHTYIFENIIAIIVHIQYLWSTLGRYCNLFPHCQAMQYTWNWSAIMQHLGRKCHARRNFLILCAIVQRCEQKFAQWGENHQICIIMEFLSQIYFQLTKRSFDTPM